MNDEQKVKLLDALKNFSAMRVDALAARLGTSEDGLARLLQDRGLVTYRKAGTVWVQGRRSRWTLRRDPKEHADGD
ncbi:MAG TPA: hypothetical protein VFE48_22365 [Methylomirabilota bacterium]|nr:hypothetical protein [Methylomirabilota bacterium]